jgi:hypothetical protein
MKSCPFCHNQIDNNNDVCPICKRTIIERVENKNITNSSQSIDIEDRENKFTTFADTSHYQQSEPRKKSKRILIILGLLIIIGVSLFFIFKKPSKESIIRTDITNLVKYLHSGSEYAFKQELAKVLSHIDTSYIIHIVKVGQSYDPGIKRIAIVLLTQLQQQCTTDLQLYVGRYVLELMTTTDEYTKELGTGYLYSLNSDVLLLLIKRVAIDNTASLGSRQIAVQFMMQISGQDVATFILQNYTLFPSTIKISDLLNEFDPYDVVIAKMQLSPKTFPLDIENSIKNAEITLKHKSSINFIKSPAPYLAENTVEIVIHNEAPVNLYLDMMAIVQQRPYNLMVPNKSIRNLSFRYGQYFYKAYAKESDIQGISGYKEFEGKYSYEWVFFLESQMQEIKRKYPGLKSDND